jgi:hypothetical protein
MTGTALTSTATRTARSASSREVGFGRDKWYSCVEIQAPEERPGGGGVEEEEEEEGDGGVGGARWRRWRWMHP